LHILLNQTFTFLLPHQDTVKSECLWLIGIDKTFTSIDVWFQCRLALWF
jgi:hypothetical protein